MKNEYLIEGDTVRIFIKRKGELMETIIDLEDLGKLKILNFSWYGHKQRNSIYVVAHNNIIKQQPDMLPLHRLIMGFPNVSKGFVIDHINRNPLDNRKSNLRIVTRVENARNCGIPKDNVSGTKGVYFYKRDEVWMARISANGKRISLGTYQDIEDAMKARKEAEKEYWGVI